MSTLRTVYQSERFLVPAFKAINTHRLVQALRVSTKASRIPSTVRTLASGSMTRSQVNLLVLNDPKDEEVKLLEKLPSEVKVVGVGKNATELSGLSDEDWASVEVVLGGGTGSVKSLQAVWPKLTGLKWIHGSSAGVEGVLFPELVSSKVKLSNAKGAFSHSLGEYSLAACNWFAKELPRLKAQQREHKWEKIYVEELRGQTLGVVGFGDIGKATAKIALAFKMKIAAMRRQTSLTEEEAASGLEVHEWYTPDRLNDLMAASDYVVLALPWTPKTDKLIGASALAAMKPTGVLINVGRGKTVDEDALIDALKANKIRGAALDVTAIEPLPEDSPLWDMENVLLSPHCADRTKTFQAEAWEQFLENITGYVAGREPFNIVDKSAGY